MIKLLKVTCKRFDVNGKVAGAFSFIIPDGKYVSTATPGTFDDWMLLLDRWFKYRMRYWRVRGSRDEKLFQAGKVSIKKGVDLFFDTIKVQELSEVCTGISAALEQRMLGTDQWWVSNIRSVIFEALDIDDDVYMDTGSM